MKKRELLNNSSEPLIPERATLPSLREVAAKCRACDLWERGTQTVFGEGVRRARAIFIGEQPGNEEDLSGRPFVGPAGRLLDQALVEAGIDRSNVYVTNVVKHFKWEPRGKRRIHKKPNSQEITACLPWLEAEISVIKGHRGPGGAGKRLQGNPAERGSNRIKFRPTCHWNCTSVLNFTLLPILIRDTSRCDALLMISQKWHLSSTTAVSKNSINAPFASLVFES